MNSRVLIVEDDQNTLSGLVELLRLEGYLAQGVPRAYMALDVVANEVIDLILCDYRLPDMSGVELCRRIRHHYPDIPLLMVTAYSSPELRKAADEIGVERIFSKPMVVDDLIDCLGMLSEKCRGSEPSRKTPKPRLDNLFI